MRAISSLLAVAALVALGGCLGENRKPRDESSSSNAPVVARTGHWFIYREISSTEPSSRLVIEKDGRATFERGVHSSLDAITVEEHDLLKALGSAVAWTDLPYEFTVPPSRPVPPNALTYEVTYGGIEPARSVTTHDGADGEPDELRRLRAKLQAVSRRIEEGRR
jgi:hypothetical protein